MEAKKPKVTKKNYNPKTDMLSTVSRPGAGIKSMKSVPRKVVVGRIFDFLI